MELKKRELKNKGKQIEIKREKEIQQNQKTREKDIVRNRNAEKRKSKQYKRIR